MIVAERKPFDRIRAMLSDCKSVLVAGCGTCVAVCLAGGEKEAKILAKELLLAARAEGREIRVDAACVQRQCDMEFLAQLDEKMAEYDCVVSMACGAGVQFMAERFPEKPIFPGVDTTHIGVNRDVGRYEERCRACGECVLGDTGGVCPVTMCAKGLFNGPCGGTSGESCEVNPDQPCAWVQIYKRLSAQGRLEKMMAIPEPRDWSGTTPRKTVQPGYEKPEGEKS